jgi:hypothetical protein
VANGRSPLGRVLHERFFLWLRPAVFLGHNPLTLSGAVLTTSSAVTLLWFWAYEILKGGAVHPYTGIIFFLFLPGIFVAGLILMPAGVYLRRRKLRAAGQLPTVFPAVDLRQPQLQRALVLFVAATFLNVAIIGTASYRGVEYMDSVQFCGQACHSVMAPEYTAYVGSPHSRVACVDCHIGSGAPWFVKAKISGARQLLAVTFGTFSRPIPSPVHSLRPARDTCEHCHWPERFQDDQLIVRTHFASDEKNTRQTTVLLLKIGGKRWNGSTGIHGRHITSADQISYVSTDDRRQLIPVVSLMDSEGRRTEFVSKEATSTPEQLARGEHRTMDCMDCHNRPTHAFQVPEKAVDQSMAAGAISTELPFIKKKAVELLKVPYPDRESAAAKIESSLAEYYKASYPDTYRGHRASIEIAVQEVQRIYRRNIYPALKIGWGTYPNNIGHEDFLGCFRCHDGSHVSKEGKTITQDCDACHTILAQEESDPKILADLGVK